MPPYRPLDLVGLHAYAEKSISAGETLHLRTSSTVPYVLSICRLGLKVDDPAGDEVLAEFPQARPKPQPIHPGSYVHVAKGLAGDQEINALTLECWVRPWQLEGRRGLVTQHEEPGGGGFGLLLGPKGEVQFALGDATHSGPSLQRRRWQHVVGTWDGQAKSLWLDGRCVGRWTFRGSVRPGPTALRLAAFGEKGAAAGFLDGDLAMPAVYGRALSTEEIRARLNDQGLHPPAGEGLLACWPLAEERGDRLADVSGQGRHGRIVNEATWMIGGPSFDGGKVPQSGPYDPARDPRRGHGLRFASDDLYDCRWQVTQEYRLPKTAKPGIYVARFRFETGGLPRTYHATFLVKKAAERPKAPLLVIAPSNCWLAYSATSFALTPPGLHYHWGTGGISNSPGDPPAYCMYRNHRAGQPAYKVGVNRPWPNAGPYVLYAEGGSGYSHLMRADRFALTWLEQSGYDYDMVGDLDLHRDPDLLRGYKAVLINGHAEYWSAEAYDALDRYLRDGGNLAVLSGNVMLWRVSFDAEGTVMECRKFDPRLGGRENATVGELWHSHDGRRGSLMRECGYPTWKLIGLDFLGWWGIGPKDFGVYHVEQPRHFLFERPERVDVERGTTFGGAPGGGPPRAIGHECDVRLPLLRTLTTQAPGGAAVPEEPPGIVTLANGVIPQAKDGYDYFTRKVPIHDGVVGQMIYWERPQGGKVFHAGSLGSGWGLSADPKFQTLLRNVLHHFGVERRNGR